MLTNLSQNQKLEDVKPNKLKEKKRKII